MDGTCRATETCRPPGSGTPYPTVRDQRRTIMEVGITPVLRYEREDKRGWYVDASIGSDRSRPHHANDSWRQRQHRRRRNAPPQPPGQLQQFGLVHRRPLATVVIINLISTSVLTLLVLLSLTYVFVSRSMFLMPKRATSLKPNKRFFYTPPEKIFDDRTGKDVQGGGRLWPSPPGGRGGLQACRTSSDTAMMPIKSA